MIPGYRLRFYCLLGALFCLASCWVAALSLMDGLTLGQFDAVTGFRPHKIKEHLVFNEQPWRFAWYLLGQAALCVAGGGAGLALAWVVLRGRRAFKRWPQGF